MDSPGDKVLSFGQLETVCGGAESAAQKNEERRIWKRLLEQSILRR